MGAFTVLYGTAAPGRFRLLLTSVVALEHPVADHRPAEDILAEVESARVSPKEWE